jgi:hemolysin III
MICILSGCSDRCCGKSPDKLMKQGERLNTITHMIGSAMALAGFIVLIVFAAQRGDPWRIVSFSVYGVTLVVLYLFSTIYHGISGKAKVYFQKLDHTAIYLLIAGTYTPFTLVSMRGVWGWSLFGIIWALAIAGIMQEMLLKSTHRVLSVVIYLLMGWLVVGAIQPLARALAGRGIIWMVAGGLFYTVGVFFYACDKKIRNGHAIFHIFVLAGSVCHYITILFYIAIP